MKNIKDLAIKVASKHNISQKNAHSIIESTFEEISNFLVVEKEEVRIKNFAVFKFGKIAAKKIKHPSTKNVIEVPKKKTVRLSLSCKIKDGLNEREN